MALQQTGERQIAEQLEHIKPNHRNRYQFAIDMILRDIGPHAKVLDCACGVGYGTMMLAEQLEHAHGFDVEPEAIAAAIRAYHLPNNTFKVCDLGDPAAWAEAIAGEAFDAIVSIETIEHLQDAEDLLARYAAQVPYLIASVPNQTVVPFEKARHPFHFRHYTRSEFSELLQRHGFEIVTWATQYDKIPGIVYEDADDGMGFIVAARRV